MERQISVGLAVDDEAVSSSVIRPLLDLEVEKLLHTHGMFLVVTVHLAVCIEPLLHAVVEDHN